MSSPKVSIIVPCYNHSRFIEECIGSVLAQDYSAKELIVIDDGSQDSSPEILKGLALEHGFRLILKTNEGVCRTLNRGIEIATGEFITFIASDDVMPPQRISQQVQSLIDHPEVSVVAGAVHVIDEESSFLAVKTTRCDGLVSFEQLLKKNMIYAPTAMFRREVFQKHGYYPETHLFEDYYMWLKITKAGGRILNTDKVWAYYRINRSNLERRFRWYFDGFKQTLEEYRPDPRVEASLRRSLLAYCAKMTFLKGLAFLKTHASEVEGLRLHYRLALWFIGILPARVRLPILMRLLQSI